MTELQISCFGAASMALLAQRVEWTMTSAGHVTLTATVIHPSCTKVVEHHFDLRVPPETLTAKAPDEDAKAWGCIGWVSYQVHHECSAFRTTIDVERTAVHQ